MQSESKNERTKAVNFKTVLSQPRTTVVAKGLQKPIKTTEEENQLVAQEEAMRVIGQHIKDSSDEDTEEDKDIQFNISTVSYKDKENKEHMIVAASCKDSWITNELLELPEVKAYQEKYGVTIDLIRSAELPKNMKKYKGPNPLKYGEIRQHFNTEKIMTENELEGKKQDIQSHSLVIIKGEQPPESIQLLYKNWIGLFDTIPLEHSDKVKLRKYLPDSNTPAHLQVIASDASSLISDIRSIVNKSGASICPYKCCEPLTAALLEQKIVEAGGIKNIKDIRENNFQYKSNLVDKGKEMFIAFSGMK